MRDYQLEKYVLKLVDRIEILEDKMKNLADIQHQHQQQVQVPE